MRPAPFLIHAAWLLLLVLLVAGGCRAPKDQTGGGILRGNVTIGPLSPVSRVGVPDPTPHPGVYAARKIMVYERDGRTIVAQADIGPNGEYSVNLVPGSYVVDINRIGIDSADGFPRSVTISSGQTMVLDVNIDTGIR